MIIDPDEKISMIGLDGGLRKVPGFMKDELQAKGWKVVVNPKREYYPEYDRAIAKDISENTQVDDDFLELERL